jgi:hypothetical protein
MLCIPNNAAMQLHTAKDEFFKLVNDLQCNSQSKKSSSQNNSSKNFSLGDYMMHDVLKLNTPDLLISKNHFQFNENACSSYSATDEQPPDFLS